MKKLSICYVGSSLGTSFHRYEALKRMGHEVLLIDPRLLFPSWTILELWIWRTGGLFLDQIVKQRVLSRIRSRKFDLVYVDGGELVNPSLVRRLKKRVGKVINYNMDDPYTGRDLRKWRLYLESVSLYDLVIVLRDCNLPEALAAGARDVMRVTMSADEIAHSPRNLNEEERTRLASDVLFVGTWMPERGPFLAKLVELGVPLSIYGNRWSKANEWPVLSSCWRGPGMPNEEQYSKLLQSAKVCIGLLSKGNRDLSTLRSFEIPLLGGVLCAERTTEHLALYRENEEAVFWDTPEECAEKCKQLLANPAWREQLSRNGRKRCLENGSINQPILERILRKAFSFEAPASETSSNRELFDTHLAGNAK